MRAIRTGEETTNGSPTKLKCKTNLLGYVLLWLRRTLRLCFGTFTTNTDTEFIEAVWQGGGELKDGSDGAEDR